MTLRSTEITSHIFFDDWKIYSISNKSTKTIQVQLYTIAKKKKKKERKKRHEMHTFKGRVKGKERNVMAAI